MRTLAIPGERRQQQISPNREEIAGKTEIDALVAYLQVLGTALK